jgi:GTP cyclohydrolase I
MVELPDIQNQGDNRGIPIDRVGITNVLFPIKVRKREGGILDTPSRIQLFVGLPEEDKGVNMSRFMECLVDFGHKIVSFNTMPELLNLLKERLKSDDAFARFEFDYFIDKKSPVSERVAPQPYRCAFTGVKKNGHYDFIMEVNVVAAAVCPCSKEMSLLENLGEINGEGDSERICRSELIDFENSSVGKSVGMGAHNQRSNIKVEIISKKGEMIWIEDVVEMVEENASAATYPILKRPDEKWVTERGYKNAKFSEDITRDVFLAIKNFPKTYSFKLRVYNEESIHPYDVSCYLSSENWKY